MIYQSGSWVKIVANDTKLYFAHGDCNITAASNRLSHFCSLSTRWQLQVAFSKCNVISLGQCLECCEFY